MSAPRKIVLGLGNPGLRYRDTRHNLGFAVVDRLARRWDVALRAAGDLRRYAWVGELERDAMPVVLAKPRTYMNRSGRAGAALCREYGSRPEDCLVVFDDADLELGRIRLRGDGGAGGHNGIRSLIDVWGSARFTRIRLGVRGAGRGDRELADYVLDRFEEDERPIADRLVELGADAVAGTLDEGLERAMNLFNGRRVGDDLETGPD